MLLRPTKKVDRSDLGDALDKNVGQGDVAVCQLARLNQKQVPNRKQLQKGSIANSN